MHYRIFLAILFLGVANTAFAADSTGLSSESSYPSSTGTRYYIANGTTFITRFPDRIEFADKRATDRLTFTGSINSIPLHETITLLVSQSEEEFTEQLSRGGIFSKEDDAKRKRNSNWTRTFLLTHDTFPIITHNHEFIESGSTKVLSMVFRLADRTTAELSFFQTEEEFTETLIRHNLLVGIVTGRLQKLPHDEIMAIPPEYRYYLIRNNDFCAKYPDRIIFNDCAFYGSICLPKGTAIDDAGRQIEESTTLAVTQTEEEFLRCLERLGVFSREYDAQCKVKSNWSGTFMTKIYVDVTHTPSYVIIDGDDRMNKATSITIDDFIESKAGQIRFTRPLHLDLFQTREEFVKALVQSGAYDPILDSSRKWIHTFRTKVGVNITHLEDKLLIESGSGATSTCSSSYTTCSVSAGTDLSGFKLHSDLELDIFQTREQFETALRISGLID